MDPGLLAHRWLRLPAFGRRPEPPPSHLTIPFAAQGDLRFFSLPVPMLVERVRPVKAFSADLRHIKIAVIGLIWPDTSETISLLRRRSMVKRSPRYPRHTLPKATEMVGKLFTGAHQSKVDANSAAKVIGYGGSTGGAAQSALAALRQYGLVDGLRGDVAVSDLAMRILQPMDETERVEAMRAAAMKPEMFGRVLNQFGGRLPGADEPIRSFLIRQEGFSAAGADELIETLRSSLASLPEATSRVAADATEDVGEEESQQPETVAAAEAPPPATAAAPVKGELITLPLGQNCKAELRLIGDVTDASYARLIKHLELLREIAAEESS